MYGIMYKKTMNIMMGKVMVEMMYKIQPGEEKVAAVTVVGVAEAGKIIDWELLVEVAAEVAAAGVVVVVSILTAHARHCGVWYMSTTHLEGKQKYKGEK